MKILLSTSGGFTLMLLILLCALCKVSPYKIDPSEGSYDKTHKRAMILRSRNVPGQNSVEFSMFGMPVHYMKDYDPEVELQKLQGNYTLPPVYDSQLQEVIKHLREPKFGLCWSLSGLINSFAKVEGIPSLKPSSVLSSLFCFNDDIPAIEKDNTDPAHSILLRLYQESCVRAGNTLIEESIYTEDYLATKNITNSMKCYGELPCSRCQQEVIEIRRDNKTVWNIIQCSNGAYCTKKQDAIPAATVDECLLNGGSFIKSTHAKYPRTTVRCVSRQCKDVLTGNPIEVNYVDFKYNNCDMDEVVKEMKRHEVQGSLSEATNQAIILLINSVVNMSDD